MRSFRPPAASLLGPSVRKRTAATLRRLLPADQPFEEESIPDYDASHFCQVCPGDIVGGGRYSVISKLGWGRTSTVWLAKDLQRWRWQPQRYVTIKFNNCDVDPESIQQELSLLRRLSTADSSHRGFHIVRKTIDSFELTTGSGTHLCLVHKPLLETLEIYRWRFPGGCLPIPLLKIYAKVLLVGFDYLHTRCNIIHTGTLTLVTALILDGTNEADLKLDNILLSFENESVLSDEAQKLQDSEFLFKESSGRRVFQSRNNFGPLRSYIATPIVADFGLAENADTGAHPIQPDAYRAPEILLGWGWSSSADIWNLGNLIWTLANGVDLFKSLHSSHGIYDAVKHLGQMVAVLGHPTHALIRQRSQSGWRWSPAIENQKGELCDDACSFYGGPFFDSATYKFIHMEAVPSPQSLHELAMFEDGDEKAGFVDLMSAMLTWDPRERSTARDLLDHPWLASKVS